jgi:RHS repeat-associated protein
MLSIDDATPAHKVSFVLDALGRHASQTIGSGGGSLTTAYAYLGTSNTVSSMSVGTSVTTTSLIDAIGNRLGQGTASGLGGYLLADLHGNIAGAVSAGGSPTLLSAYRYDAYGETCGSWTADSGSLSVPWRFQGRLLESISGTTTDLYDFGARSYDPSLGAFTSFDSVAGSAGNPLTLNRYLYANANPATLVDPDGHAARMYDEGPVHRGLNSGAAPVKCNSRKYGREECDTNQHRGTNKPASVWGTTDMTSGVDNFRSWSGNTDMTTAVDNFRSETGAGACRWSQTADECKNIAAEDHYNQYFAACQDGDKSACTKKGSIKVDTGDPIGALGAVGAAIAGAVVYAGGQVVTHAVAAIEDLLDVHTVGWCGTLSGFIGAGGLGIGGSIQLCGMTTATGQTGVTVSLAAGAGQGNSGWGVSTGPMFSSGQDVEDQEQWFQSGSFNMGRVAVDSQWGTGHCKVNPNAVSTQYVGKQLRGDSNSIWQGFSRTWVIRKNWSAPEC